MRVTDDFERKIRKYLFAYNKLKKKKRLYFTILFIILFDKNISIIF